MSRSPLAYPLTRAADSDVGGAADLQTDVMRFMAILALCLVAIFALVQSIPLAPVPEAAPPVQEAPAEPATPRELPEERLDVSPATPAPPPATTEQPPADTAVVLTRPKWTPSVMPPAPVEAADPTPAVPSAVPAVEPPEQEGFTLRFASDAALMRAVAAQRVGVYAIEPARAKRMTVSESRISFWDASMPNSFHEMETLIVPAAVVDALSRAAPDAGSIKWGVTLPGRMKAQLDALMEEHRGGALIIGANGDIHWEAMQ